MKADRKSELSSEISDSAHELFKRLLGYYGRDRRKKQGPSLLGMETNFHERIPEADEIDRAVQEVKDLHVRGRFL